MKTVKRAFVLLLTSLLAFGAPGDIKLSQKNSANTAWLDRIFADGPSGYMLATSGSGIGYFWAAPATTGPLPSQTGNSGKILTTDGSGASWSSTIGAVNSITSAATSNLTLTASAQKNLIFSVDAGGATT